jgi:hypothetical protein
MKSRRVWPRVCLAPFVLGLFLRKVGAFPHRLSAKRCRQQLVYYLSVRSSAGRARKVTMSRK